jgi:hypothetical protein
MCPDQVLGGGGDASVLGLLLNIYKRLQQNRDSRNWGNTPAAEQRLKKLGKHANFMSSRN